MTHARDMALGAALVGLVYAAGLTLGQWLFDRSILYPH
jgi:hypothetical protein